MKSRKESEALMNQYIENENLRQHCCMVAAAMESYARERGENQEEVEAWWTAGMLHDLDWEKFPEEHPAKAVREILPSENYPGNVIKAVATHAPERTGIEPDSPIERYLFACDELSGFMNAVSLMRPNGFEDMKVKSVTKKLKDKRFAANVPREDIHKGAALIDTDLKDHIIFLIDVFKEKP